MPEGIPERKLQDNQSCLVHVFDADTNRIETVFETREVLLEAPNWIEPDVLILNGDGILWRLNLSDSTLQPLEIPGLPGLNNDHVPGTSSDIMFASGYDGHIYQLSLTEKTAKQVTRPDPSSPLLHFLHGVSPVGDELSFVGVEEVSPGVWGRANIYTISVDGGCPRQLTFGDAPADGPEYSPDGEWIYFNTEAFSTTPGHAQIARMRRDGGGLEQLTFDSRVNWFPHFSQTGDRACYLSFPPGTVGHPANLEVELKLVDEGKWKSATTVARLIGGQGTINVNSWSLKGKKFAYVSYPFGPVI